MLILASGSVSFFTAMLWLENWLTACYLRLLFRETLLLPCSCSQLMEYGTLIFFRRVIPPFCVSQKLSTLGAVTCGYISAVWPLILILLVSLAMELNKRDFKITVYPWKFIDGVSCVAVRHWLAQTNPVHIFATFFVLSYSKILFVSFCLLKITYPQQLSRGNTNNLRRLSFDPHIHYFSPRHLPYVVPVITIIVTLGVLLPLLLMLYPTRCGSRYFGGRIVKTFIYRSFSGQLQRRN